MAVRSLVPCLVVALATLFTSRATAQDAPYIFVASVYDRVSRQPVEAAFAAALGTESWAVTDRNGSFRLNGLTGGRHIIRVWRLGYTPTTFSVTFDSSHTNVLEAPIVIDPIPVQMPELVVEADRTRLVAGALKEFYRRRRDERGWFFTREEIDARRADRFHELVQTVPGIRVNELGNRRVTLRFGNDCPPVYYVDGIQSNEDLALSLRPERLEAVELYRRPTEIPAELNVAGAACGVIMLWSRR